MAELPQEIEPSHPLVVSEHRGCLFLKVRDNSLPPVSEMMRVQLGGIQDAVHGGRVQRGDLTPLDLIMQGLNRPAHPRPARLLWRGAGQGDDLHPLQGGKVAAGDRCAADRRDRPRVLGRSVGASAPPSSGCDGGRRRWPYCPTPVRPEGRPERGRPVGAWSCRPGRGCSRAPRSAGVSVMTIAGGGPFRRTPITASMVAVTSAATFAAVNLEPRIRADGRNSCFCLRTWAMVH